MKMNFSLRLMIFYQPHCSYSTHFTMKTLTQTIFSMRPFVSLLISFSAPYDI